MADGNSDVGGISFTCFRSGNRRWCEVDVSPPGESEHLDQRFAEYGDAYKAQHGDFPDWLDDEHVDLLDRWRQEYRAWYAEDQRARAQRATFQLLAREG